MVGAVGRGIGALSIVIACSLAGPALAQDAEAEALFEAGRVALTRAVKRGGKIWIRVFPDKPFTKKPAETRMGKGKGNPEYWVAVVKPGRILYEMEGLTEDVAREAFRLAGQKLPIRTKMVKREQS